MSRHFLFMLLLVMGIALADEKPQAQTLQAAGAAEAQAKTEAAHGRTEKPQAKTEAAQGRTQQVQAMMTEEAQGQTEGAQGLTDEDAKLTSVPGGKALGMSILGNQDAPKSLVIVPWKSSELGDTPGISPMLDASRQPVDKEVFIRALLYYEIRSRTKP